MPDAPGQINDPRPIPRHCRSFCRTLCYSGDSARPAGARRLRRYSGANEQQTPSRRDAIPLGEIPVADHLAASAAFHVADARVRTGQRLRANTYVSLACADCVRRYGCTGLQIL